LFLKEIKSADLVEVMDVSQLFDPSIGSISVRFQAGEEVGDSEDVNKGDLIFPSGEALPKCWLDIHYRMNFN